MRVLIVHDRYQQRGGEDQSVEARIRLLRDQGHTVDTVFEDNARLATMGQLQAAANTLWSRENYRRLRSVLKTGRYDVMDAHNTFPLVSPAAYFAALAEGTAVAQTLHNYRLLCPGATFFRSGHPCEDCLGRRVAWPAVQHACYRRSRRASATVATMIGVHRILGTWSRAVDAYLALTDFARSKFITGGLPKRKIVVAPNFVDPDPGPGEHTGDYALFVGRLTPEKGIMTLLAAWQRTNSQPRLKVVGDGPLAEDVRSAAEKTDGLEWLGQKTSGEVMDLMGRAQMVIVPSEWYETFGLVVIEAFARGTPVIASRIGALAELVDHGETGLLFTPGDAESLAECVERASDRAADLQRIGAAGRQKFLDRYTAAKAGPAIIAGYELAIASSRSR